MNYWVMVCIVLLAIPIITPSTASSNSKHLPLQMRSRFSFVKQAVNLPALQKLSVVFRRPGLLLPDLSLGSVAELDMGRLKKELGIRCVVFDKDNTLSLCYVDELHESVRETVEQSKIIFGERCVAILSNSVGSCDDLDYKGAAETEQNMQLPVIRHVEKKPACLREVLAHFEHLTPELKASEICIVGDRVLTDVLFANLNGMLSVLVKPLSIRTDHPIAVVIRSFERWILLPFIRGFGLGRGRHKGEQ